MFLRLWKYPPSCLQQFCSCTISRMSAQRSNFFFMKLKRYTGHGKSFYIVCKLLLLEKLQSGNRNLVFANNERKWDMLLTPFQHTVHVVLSFRHQARTCKEQQYLSSNIHKLTPSCHSIPCSFEIAPIATQWDYENCGRENDYRPFSSFTEMWSSLSSRSKSVP